MTQETVIQTKTMDWEAVMQQMTKDDLSSPRTSIDTFMAGCDNLLANIDEDKKDLNKAGLDWEIINEAKELKGLLRYAQADWNADSSKRSEARIEWNEISPEAVDFRNQMLHHFNFAYRKSPELSAIVRKIRDGNSNADLVQDLFDLYALGTKNTEELKAIGYDLNLLKVSEKKGLKLQETLSVVNGTFDAASDLKFKRDALYSLLEERISTIREYGRYVFWRDEDRLKKYLK